MEQNLSEEIERDLQAAEVLLQHSKQHVQQKRKKAKTPDKLNSMRSVDADELFQLLTTEKPKFSPEIAQKMSLAMQKLTKSISLLVQLTKDLPLTDNSKLILCLQDAKASKMDMATFSRYQLEVKGLVANAQDVINNSVDVVRSYGKPEFESKKQLLTAQLQTYCDSYSLLVAQLGPT